MKRKNIILITSDQHHWHAMGYNNPEIKTPNLDRLAANGTIFDRAYTVNPTCTPARASLITGTYPSQHGAYSLGTKLMETVHTVGEDFQKSNYKTALIGKAHFQPLASTKEYPSIEAYPILQDLNYWKNFNGPFYGFEHVELARNHTDESHIGQHYALWMEEQGCKNWRDYFLKPTGNCEGEDNKHHWSIPEKYHQNAWIAERMNAQLEEYKNNNENFYLWASFFDPHPKCIAPEPWCDMYDPEKLTIPKLVEGEHENNPPHFKLTRTPNPDFSSYQEEGGNGMHGCHYHNHDLPWLKKEIAVYYGMVSMMDKYIGKILDKLDELGLTEDTIILFTTDHGHFYGQHGLIAKGPFHYEDMLKVPFVVSNPDLIPKGKRSDSLQSLVDLPPTFLNLCGIDTPKSMTGIDQTDVWTDKKETIRDHVSVENRHQPTTMNHRTYIDKRYKITVYYNQEYGELFDLENDPKEINNLWNDPLEESLKSKLLLKFISAEMEKEPLPMPRIAMA